MSKGSRLAPSTEDASLVRGVFFFLAIACCSLIPSTPCRDEPGAGSDGRIQRFRTAGLLVQFSIQLTILSTTSGPLQINSAYWWHRPYGLERALASRRR